MEFVEIMQFCWHDAKPPTIKSNLVHLFEIVSGRIQYLLQIQDTTIAMAQDDGQASQ
jgi:hypothetical protein